MSVPHVMVLSVSAGAGHVRAAQALCAEAETSGLSADHLDVMDFVPRWFRFAYAGLYAVLIRRAPLLWGCIYRGSNRPDNTGTVQRLRRRLERRASAGWLEKVRTRRPDAIICTHFLPAEVLAHYRKRGDITCPVWVQVTDFDLHAFWLQPEMDGYFVASEELAFQLRRGGIDPARIHVTGIALMPAFRRAAAGSVRNGRTAVLLMGGGAGVGGLAHIAAQLMEADGQFELVVLTGSNSAALTALKVIAHRWPGRLSAVGYTDQVARYMADADLVITKPGGLTTSECLAIGVPMIVNAPIPGQEERNADFLLERGVALKSVDIGTLVYRLEYLLKRPELLASMAASALALGRPDAAYRIIQTVAAHHESKD